MNACILCTSSEAASTALQEYKQTSAKGAARVLNKQTQSPVTPPTTLMTGEACMQANKTLLSASAPSVKLAATHNNNTKQT